MFFQIRFHLLKCSIVRLCGKAIFTLISLAVTPGPRNIWLRQSPKVRVLNVGLLEIIIIKQAFKKGFPRVQLNLDKIKTSHLAIVAIVVATIGLIVMVAIAIITAAAARDRGRQSTGSGR